MITGNIKSQIDQIWNAFWSGGISNPLEVIEQITYLVSGRKRKTLGKRWRFCGKRQPKKCGVGYHIGDEWQRSVRPKGCFS
jgi:hypothetical protein